MATFFIEQFGCRATQADGAALAGAVAPARLQRSGGGVARGHCGRQYVHGDGGCGFAGTRCDSKNPREKPCRARHRHGMLRATRAGRAGGAAGCFLVVGNSHKPQIPMLVDAFSTAVAGPTARGFVPAAALRPAPSADPDRMSLSHAPAKVLTGDIFEQTTLLSAPVFGGEGNHTRPVLKIQDGCNSRCSYCVIPFVRGKSRSLPPSEVIAEIQRLSEAGYREIVLSGINLGTYGRDLSPRVEFEDLLRRVLDDTCIERLRISSIEPLDVTQDLVALFTSTERIARHFHMPLQSGSDRILAGMHRWYRAEHYARRVELVHEHLPNAAIGADVIAGFPGETEQDHAATLMFLERLPFTYLHAFSFSKRPGTKAATMANEVPPAVIRRRARELRALGEGKSAAFHAAHLGKSLRVLTLRHASGEATDWTPALSSNYLHVRLPGRWAANEMVSARVLSVAGQHLHASPETSGAFPVEDVARA